MILPNAWVISDCRCILLGILVMLLFVLTVFGAADGTGAAALGLGFVWLGLAATVLGLGWVWLGLAGP
jgi:hypothetical protein